MADSLDSAEASEMLSQQEREEAIRKEELKKEVELKMAQFCRFFQNCSLEIASSRADAGEPTPSGKSTASNWVPKESSAEAPTTLPQSLSPTCRTIDRTPMSSESSTLTSNAALSTPPDHVASMCVHPGKNGLVFNILVSTASPCPPQETQGLPESSGNLSSPDMSTEDQEVCTENESSATLDSEAVRCEKDQPEHQED